MKKLIALLLAVMMVLCLCACGAETPDISGKYTATSCVIDGEEYSCDGEYVKLNADGTGTVMFMEDELDIDWTLKGDSFSFTDSEGDKFTGTYADGVLTGTYANMDYVYDMNASSSKSKAAAPAKENDEAAESEAAEPEVVESEAAAIAADSGFEPVGKDFGTCYIEVVGAEAFQDSDGKDSIRFYYDYTNQRSEPYAATYDVSCTAEQAGFELSYTYAAYGEEVAEEENDWCQVYPGVTIRCIYECNYNPAAGGTVTLTIDDYDVQLVAEFDATALPGVVKEAAEIAPITEPSYTAGLPTEAAAETHSVSLTGDYEIAVGNDDTKLLMVNIDFTNNSGEEASAWLKTSFYAYQDGVELELGSPKGGSELYDNYWESIPSGSSINCSVPFELRSDSPVEVYLVVDSWNDIAIGGVYPVA